jgi:hypothetical protein
MGVSIREEKVECRRCGRREEKQMEGGKGRIQKVPGRGMFNMLNGFRMRWKAVQINKFKMSSAWLNKRNQ